MLASSKPKLEAVPTATTHKYLIEALIETTLYWDALIDLSTSVTVMSPRCSRSLDIYFLLMTKDVSNPFTTPTIS